MISSVLMVIILGLIVLMIGVFLFSSVADAIKYNNKEWFTVSLVSNIAYWLTIIMLILKYFGL